jgi:hypothetical protein
MIDRSAAIALCWRTEETPEGLHLVLRTLAEEYDIRESGEGGLNLKFVSMEDRERGLIERKGNEVTIRYGTIPFALRGVSAAMGGLQDGESVEDHCPFTTVSMMLDCARNGVMTADHFKRWLIRLALMGFNQAMLYLERRIATIPELDGNIVPPDSYLPGLAYRNTATISDVF